MNLNQIEDLKEYLSNHQVPEKEIEDVLKKIEKKPGDFDHKYDRPADKDKGKIDVTLHFKKSGTSESYYMNRHTVALNEVKPLEEGLKYLVISPAVEQGKPPLFRKFDNPYQAIDYFKGQQGTSELAVGKSVADKTTKASMEKGSVNYVAKDFAKTFRNPPKSQTTYINRSAGFTIEQAANMLQGRGVHRSDMLNFESGVQYAAWNMFMFDAPRDTRGNYKIQQYNDPAYGFDIDKVLDKYNIKEFEKPEKKESLLSSIKNGNRISVTSEKERKAVKVEVEAAPRYKTANFYLENGKPEKREQFLKQVIQEQGQQNGQEKSQKTSKEVELSK